MIIGIGVDIVEVARMEKILQQRWATKFVSRVFSPEEIASCRKAAQPAQAFAARFAAKEAFSKALGTGFSRGISPSGIHVCGGDGSQPTIHLTGAALLTAEAMNVGPVHVSLTHTPLTACAFVVAEEKDS
ncbi:MAG: holo-ACP synthase [Desulfomonile sp.]